jgi:hypothetical protein
MMSTWWGCSTSRGTGSAGRLASSERLARLAGGCLRLVAAIPEGMASTAKPRFLPRLKAR